MPGEQDKKGLATASLVCGIASFFGICIAIVGIGLGITALVTGGMSLKSSKRGFAIAGMVCGGIGLLVSIVNSVLGVLLYTSGAFK